MNNLIWRLKVYPNGNGVAAGEYLSVFLEMVRGPEDSSKYQYKVELVHRYNPTLCAEREFQSEFETGECWGYNRFYRIELLEEKGFLDTESDSITLRFYVRAPTYAQLCRDQRDYIKSLERTRDRLTRQL